MKKYKLETIVFLGGAIGMGLELIAARVLSPYVGSSNVVWTSIIGIILVSMSFGYWIGGKKADKDANINKLANKNTRKQGGLLRGGSTSTSKYSTMLSQLLAFCRTNFYTRTEQQDYVFKALKQYLDYRIKFKLEPEQWQAILDSIKNFDAENIARRVQTALAGGYKILVPSWEVNKPQRRVDNITPQKDDDNDHHDVEGVYF